MNTTSTAATSPSTAVARMAAIRARREAATNPAPTAVAIRDEREHRFHTANITR